MYPQAWLPSAMWQMKSKTFLSATRGIDQNTKTMDVINVHYLLLGMAAQMHGYM